MLHLFTLLVTLLAAGYNMNYLDMLDN